MTDKMREEFEKWHMERYGGFGLGRSTEPGYTDEYERVGTNLQWKAWQAARTVPEGYVMVPKTIHPFDRPDCDAVVQLLATPPDAGRIDNPQDYYQYWWELLLSAAPEPKK